MSSLSITTDIWTDTLNTKSFLGVTCHFLNFNERKLRSVNIGIIELDEKHDSDYLGRKIVSVCEEWNIQSENVTAVITDNGRNIVKAVTDVFGKSKSLPCFVHTLNLVVEKTIDSSEELKSIISNVKHIVTYFKQSVVAADQLRKAQPKEKKLKLIQSVPTRWNSTFYMLERFVSLYEYITPILIRNVGAPHMINKTQINILIEILEILSPLEKVTKEICGEKYLTGSKIIPIINCLRIQLENLTPTSKGAIAMRATAIFEINKRFGCIEQIKLLSLATLLDPPFKKIHFNSAVACSQAIISANELYKELLVAIETENPEPSTSFTDEQKENVNNNSLWAYHERLALKSKNNKNENIETNELCLELKSYLNSSVIVLKNDPIEYWQLQTNKLLKEIALKYIAIIGTSVPSERLFSKAGQIMSESRNRLLGERLSKLLFLNSIELEEWHME